MICLVEGSHLLENHDIVQVNVGSDSEQWNLYSVTILLKFAQLRVYSTLQTRERSCKLVSAVPSQGMYRGNRSHSA
jgi:hypothetical protein